jgi:hypothetical protein
MAKQFVRLVLPDGAPRLVEVAEDCRTIRIPVFDRMMTPGEYAELCAAYPGSEGLSRALFGAIDYSDTGERDADGHRIFA